MKGEAHLVIDAKTPRTAGGFRERLRGSGKDGDAARAMLVQVEKLALIGQIAAGIAHEINNPVGYMLSNLSTLSEYFSDLKGYLLKTNRVLDGMDGDGADGSGLKALKGERRRIDVDFLLEDFESALKDCITGADRVRDIAMSLKTFSRRGSENTEMADLNAAVEKALALCWNELKYHCTVQRDFGKIPPLPCMPSRLGQVFVNILLNAAQAVKERGEVRVSTRVEAGHAVVRIRDTGRGIAPEHMDRLFTPFFTTKPEGQGTGLGLYLAGEIIKAHHGSIEVNSRQGAGTEFVIRLPLSDPGGDGHEEK